MRHTYYDVGLMFRMEPWLDWTEWQMAYGGGVWQWLRWFARGGYTDRETVRWITHYRAHQDATAKRECHRYAGQQYCFCGRRAV